MGILDGKRLLVTGVLMDTSIAFHVARLAQEQGAEVVLTSFGRTMKHHPGASPSGCRTTPPVRRARRHQRRAPRRAGRPGPRARRRPRRRLHSIGFAPQARSAASSSTADVGGRRHGACRSRRTRCKSLAVAAPAADGRAAARVVGLTFDATVAWPDYDWMGVAKAAFESTNRYLARDLGPEGIRVQPGRRRPAPHDRRQGDPRLRASSRRCGTTARRSAGTSTTRARPRKAVRRAAVATGSRPRPARSCTSTAASTRWVPEPAPPTRLPG